MDLKNNKRGRIKEYAKEYGCEYTETEPEPNLNGLWGVEVDIALRATQNEMNGKEAKMLSTTGVAVAEGANMPCTPEAIKCFHQHGLLFAPGKASNAGGVATSGLEMSQNSLRLNWPRGSRQKIEEIMVNIHRNQKLQRRWKKETMSQEPT